LTLNVFAVVILTAIVIDYAVGLVADLFNLRALRLEVPEPLKDIYKSDDYRRSQEYTRATTLFGIVSGTIVQAAILVFWFAGGFGAVDRLVRSPGLPVIIEGLLFIGILLAGYALLELPFSIYRTFVIEERFGFNRTTRATFLIDRLKELALALVLGVPLLAGILALFEYGGSYAWLFVWAAVTVYSLTVQFIAPVWIMPLFNKFTPMADGELKEAILEYARLTKFPVANVFVMDGSRRSTRSNAYFSGFGRNKRIALFDTLIKQHTVQEIVAVLAHEIGHYKKKHIIIDLLVSIAHTGLLFFLLSVFLNTSGLYEAFHTEQSVYAGLVFFSLLYTPVEMVLSVITNAISRAHEQEADRFAAATIKEPHSLAEVLKKLSANNLSNLTPHPFYIFINYSHPPLLQRIRAIKAQ
jgi:STE24 endopeptidase